MKKLSLALIIIVVGGVLLAAIERIFPEEQTALPNEHTGELKREYISPMRIVWTEHGDNISNIEYLLREGNGQADLTNSHICVVKSTSTEHPAILLDFGRELHGGLQIVTGMPADHTPVRIRVRYGESASEAMCEIDGKNGATNDHAIRDFETTLPWLGKIELGNSGFRFVRIDLLDDNRELHLKEVRAISIMRDLKYRGTFECNDERLNQIWQTGARTVHLNMQEYLWDGIKRDRLVWMGDMHPEVMTISHVFGQNEVVPKSLDLLKSVTALPNWMNGMYTYSLWWIIVQRDWYHFHGDSQYLENQRDYLVGLLDILLTKRIDENGYETSGGGFLDWPSNANQPAMKAGTQALMMMAIKAGGELCAHLGEEAMAARCQERYAKMEEVAPKIVEQYFREAEHPTAPGSKQAASLMALAGILDAEKANADVLTVEGARGFSTFYGYYMLQAMAKAGDYEGAMQVIRDFWGAMLDMGATSFWEDFNIDWLPNAAPIDELVPEGKKDIHGDFGAYCYEGFRHSLCHGWASGPTAWMIEHVLGVEVVEAGCKVVRITPHLGELEWAKGSFPTPYGDIIISHERKADGSVKSKIDAPRGVKIIK
ncbi:MAG: alpha-L-rhamnosidase [Alistipes sp.]|nr:alpha-L-rhamnosidase [Alistipes sp.]